MVLRRREVLVDVNLMFPRFTRFLEHQLSVAIQLATSRIFDPLSLVRYPPPPVSKLRTISVWHSWYQPQTSSRVAQRSDEHGGLVGFRWNLRHKLRFCVLQKLYAPLVHKSEVVLELATELQPSSLIIVVRSRSCSKFQDFSNVRRHRITAPPPCAIYLRFYSMTICTRICGTGPSTTCFNDATAWMDNAL